MYTITSCLIFLHDINSFFFSLYRIYFKVDFIKIVAGTLYEYIYRRSLASIGLVMFHLTSSYVCVCVYIWIYIYIYLLSIFDLNILSYGEKMSQSYWLLYMSMSIVGIEARWCTHVQQHTNSILDDMCDKRRVFVLF